MPKKNNYYVNNVLFQEHLVKYAKDKDRATKEEIGKIFLIIAQRLLNKPCFIKYSPDRKDDMISDATYVMVKYINKYDPTRGNPFAYFSQTAFNGFIQNIKKTKKRNSIFIPLSYLENVGTDFNE